MAKPTLKEYLNSRNMRYVKTNEERYYVIKSFWVTYAAMIILIALLAVPPITILYLYDLPWHSEISHDFLILFLLLSLVAPILIYPFERFRLLEEGSEQYLKAFAKVYTKNGRVSQYALVAALVLINSMNSFSFAYMRSLLDTPAVECRMHMEETDKSITLESNKDDPVITLRHDPQGEIDISLWITHTPYLPKLTLDGEVIVPYDQYQSLYFWFSKDYFRQREYYTIDAEDIRDGSVLSVTCGEWRYSWVFLVNDP